MGAQCDLGYCEFGRDDVAISIVKIPRLTPSRTEKSAEGLQNNIVAELTRSQLAVLPKKIVSGSPSAMATTEVSTTTEQLDNLQLRAETSVDYEKEQVRQ